MKAAKQAAQPDPHVPHQTGDDDSALQPQAGSAADQCPEVGGDSGAVSALAQPGHPEGADSPEQPPGTLSHRTPRGVMQADSIAAAASSTPVGDPSSGTGAPSGRPFKFDEASSAGTLETSRTLGRESAAPSHGGRRAETLAATSHSEHRGGTSSRDGKGRPAPYRR